MSTVATIGIEACGEGRLLSRRSRKGLGRIIFIENYSFVLK